jgi:hypothetical protein
MSSWHGSQLGRGCLHGLVLSYIQECLHGMVVSYVQDTSSWCGAQLDTGYVFMAWCSVSYRICLHGVVLS